MTTATLQRAPVRGGQFITLLCGDGTHPDPVSVQYWVCVTLLSSTCSRVLCVEGIFSHVADAFQLAYEQGDAAEQVISSLALNSSYR